MMQVIEWAISAPKLPGQAVLGHLKRNDDAL
jgi:hypothetical protein